MTDTTAAPPPETAAEGVSATDHAVFWISALMIVAFAVWATFSTLDVVSIAEGEVIPSSQVKTVQHLEGGIVQAIAVEEGQEVVAGQTLMELEPTVSGADVAELRVRLTALEVEIAQLSALADGRETPSFSDALRAQNPDIVRQAERRFEARRARHRDAVAAKRNAVRQAGEAITEVETRISGNRESLRLVSEQVAMSQQLLDQGLVNKFRHLDLLKEQRDLRNAIETDRAGLARAEAALETARSELAGLQSTFTDDTRRALDDARLRSRELTQRIRKFEDSLQRTVVRSPVDGIVKTLHVVTVGGVVGPGEPVADIVPVGDTLIVEAKLPTEDIGYIAVGQAASVKLASADAIRYGALTGAVESVSPDTLVSENGRPYYRVRISLPSNVFEKGALSYELFPGMQVVAGIQTGERSVLGYIFDPLRTSMSGAFQER
jgi:adhesin transport system membrane fusion protein